MLIGCQGVGLQRGEICWGYKEGALFWKVSVDRRTERTPSTLTSESPQPFDFSDLSAQLKFLGHFKLKGLWPV